MKDGNGRVFYFLPGGRMEGTRRASLYSGLLLLPIDIDAALIVDGIKSYVRRSIRRDRKLMSAPWFFREFNAEAIHVTILIWTSSPPAIESSPFHLLHLLIIAAMIINGATLYSRRHIVNVIYSHSSSYGSMHPNFPLKGPRKLGTLSDWRPFMSNCSFHFLHKYSLHTPRFERRYKDHWVQYSFAGYWFHILCGSASCYRNLHLVWPACEPPWHSCVKGTVL